MDLTSPQQKQRCLLRGTWQLASVFHFLNVFRPVLDLELKFSMEELESALLVPNALLDDIHIALLKAIPPSSRNPINQETWVAVLCKKLKDWWHSVAEGPFPLIPQHQDEIVTYKDLGPDVRVIILKALCEARLDQEDMRAFIGEMAKQETSFLSIRKERTGSDMQGGIYWYENDPIAGQRLYKELQRSDTKDKAKIEGHLVSAPATSQWETLATNLDEFQSVADKLCSSRNKMEVVLGKKINSDIVPDLINAEKRKQRMLKKQLRQAVLLDNNHSEGVACSRQRRERKPVSYTFDDYDNSINEAIEVMKGLHASRVMEDSKLSNGAGREDIDEKMYDEIKVCDSTAQLGETSMRSSKSEFLSNKHSGRGGRNRVPQRTTNSDSSGLPDSDTDAIGGCDSEGEAACVDDHLLSKRRRLARSSDASDRRIKETKEDVGAVCGCDVKEEDTGFVDDGVRDLKPRVFRREENLQVIKEARDCLAQSPRADADCIKHEGDKDVKNLERAECDEMATLVHSHGIMSNSEDLVHAGFSAKSESSGNNKGGIEMGHKSKDVQAGKVAIGTKKGVKQERLDDCRPARKKPHRLMNSNGLGPVGV